MLKIEGHELDLEQSSDGTNDFQWRLVFTKGVFQGPSVSKTVEPVQFLLKRKDYDFNIPKGYYIYFNPLTNKYNIIENNIDDCIDLDLGYNIGGFLVRNCRLTFVYPKCSDNVTYVRPWAEEFNEAYEKREISCEDQEDMCGTFNKLNFSSDFETECPIIEDNNEFYYAEFENDEFSTEQPQ